MLSKIWMILAVLAAAGGLFFLGVAGKYTFGYYANPGAEYRHEYMQVVIFALIAALPCWLAASGFLWLVREVVPKVVLFSVYSVSLLLCALYLVSNLYAFVMWLLNK